MTARILSRGLGKARMRRGWAAGVRQRFLVQLQERLEMKIAVVSTMGYSSGGSEALWTEMARTALGSGHEIAAVCFRWPETPAHLVDLQRRGARLLTRPLRQNRVSRVLTRFAAPLGSLRAFRPDVVLFNQGASFDVVQDREVRRFLRERVDRGPGAGFAYVIICHLNVEEEIPGDSDRREIRRFFAAAHRVLAVSPRLLDTVRRQLADPLPNGLVVNNPVNLANSDQVAYPPMDGPVRMACLGSLLPVKGWDILFESLAGDMWRSRDWRLTVAGDGHLRGYLSELAHYFGIADRIDFAGFVKNVRELWGCHHLMVFASRREGGPMVVVEALVCGRPVVSTDVGLVSDWVREGETGFIASAPTVRSFRAALERAWAAKPRWPEMGHRAHEFAVGRADPDPGGTLLRILCEVAGHSTPVGPAAK